MFHKTVTIIFLLLLTTNSVQSRGVAACFVYEDEGPGYTGFDFLSSADPEIAGWKLVNQIKQADVEKAKKENRERKKYRCKRSDNKYKKEGGYYVIVEKIYTKPYYGKTYRRTYFGFGVGENRADALRRAKFSMTSDAFSLSDEGFKISKEGKF